MTWSARCEIERKDEAACRGPAYSRSCRRSQLPKPSRRRSPRSRLKPKPKPKTEEPKAEETEEPKEEAEEEASLKGPRLRSQGRGRKGEAPTELRPTAKAEEETKTEEVESAAPAP